MDNNILKIEEIIKYAQVDKITRYAENVGDLFVVIGIGGSYLGAKAVIEALSNKYKKEEKVLFIGDSLSAIDLEDTLEFLRDKDFVVNVISKSGTTLETMLTFNFIEELMKEKYGEDRHSRIVVTTGTKGKLRRRAEINKWEIFEIPEEVGGRYSIFTPVGLLPMAMNGINIKEFVNGAVIAYEEKSDEILKYSMFRYTAYKTFNKKVEVLAVYEPRLELLTKWWEQLFGESQGKDGIGLYPSGLVFSRDLHSLGQLIQDGERNIIETIISVENSNSNLVADNFNGFIGNLGDLNKMAVKGVSEAHRKGGVPVMEIKLAELTPENLGMIVYVFMASCIISASLLGVNPFGQPGVEEYKANIKKLLEDAGDN